MTIERQKIVLSCKDTQELILRGRKCAHYQMLQNNQLLLEIYNNTNRG